MDSRRHIFLYPLNSRADLPDDFDLSNEDFETGIFLPQDDPDWFGRVDYPARVILLQDASLLVASHPSAAEAPTRIPLADLHQLEVGRILLIGWLSLRFGNSECLLPYNTRGTAPLEAFLRRMREKWLFRSTPPHRRWDGKHDFGEPMDLKFRNMRLREVEHHEDLRLQFFQAAREIWTRFLFYHRRKWQPGDLVSTTDRSLVWITDRRRGRREFYGGIARHAPLSALTEIRCREQHGSYTLELSFVNSVKWSVPVTEDLAAAAAEFVAAMRSSSPNRVQLV